MVIDMTKGDMAINNANPLNQECFPIGLLVLELNLKTR